MNMKRTLILTLLLAGTLALRAQTDSAQLVVDTYLQFLNAEGLPSDSTLYIESRIVVAGQTDTLLMKRWFQDPNLTRTELWMNRQLQMGIVSDGKGVHHLYNTKRRAWALISHETLLSHQSPYDFRGPLHNYRVLGAELTYQGMVKYNGSDCHKVLVRQPGRYDRHYFFQRGSCALFFIEELETTFDEDITPEGHVDWRGVMEYTPLRLSMLPSQEAYQQQDHITLISHTYSLIPFNADIFKEK